MTLRRFEPLVKTKYIPALNGRNQIGKAWTIQNGFRIVIYDAKKVIDILSEDADIRITVTLSATDALSQAKVVTRQSYSSSDIIEGDFRSVNMEIT